MRIAIASATRTNERAIYKLNHYHYVTLALKQFRSGDKVRAVDNWAIAKLILRMKRNIL